MAKNNKQVRPIPVLLAIVMFIVAIAVMALFVTHIVAPSGNGESSHVDSLGEQSFAEETSVEPPPPEVSEIKEYMSDANVGDVVTFGKYEQDNNKENGAEPIEWIVVDETEEGLRLISRYCLDCKPYNETRASVGWDKSTLRAWLNGDFYKTAFSEKEQEGILLVSEMYQVDGIDGAYSLSFEDAVTIPTEAQAKDYFEYDSWRACSATDFALANGAREESGFAWWWLRSLSSASDTALYVHFNGVAYNGFAVDYNAVAVRPMIWVSANAEKE